MESSQFGGENVDTQEQLTLHAMCRENKTKKHL